MPYFVLKKRRRNYTVCVWLKNEKSEQIRTALVTAVMALISNGMIILRKFRSDF